MSEVWIALSIMFGSMLIIASYIIYAVDLYDEDMKRHQAYLGLIPLYYGIYKWLKAVKELKK